MRITLISPRIAIQKGDFLGSGVPYWPVDLAVLAAYLKEKGNDVSVIDLFGASPDTLEEKDDHYLQGKPFRRYIETPQITEADLFILYAMSYMSHGELISIVNLIRSCRDNVLVCMLENSQAVTAYALPQVSEDFFHCGVDALFCGEVYWNWDEIETFIKGSKTVPENVLIPNPPKDHKFSRKIKKKPSYPVPAWELFDVENYWSLPYSHGPKTKRYLPMLTSRGCPYPCDFCVVPETNNKSWRPRSAEEVVDEFITLRDKFGVRHFQIEDLNPTVKGARWDKICSLLVERKVGIFFYFVSGTKAESINIEQIPTYARAGCRYISISPESGSTDVLKAIGKTFDHAHGLALIEACHKNGIYTQACLLVGHPAEKSSDHKLSCDYLQNMVEIGLDEVGVFVVAPFAGSKLHKQGTIDQDSSQSLVSFSPKGRQNWETLAQRRSELIKIFFIGKLKKGPGIWIQGVRALLGTPKTKMENLPRRIVFIYRILLKYYISKLFTSKTFAVRKNGMKDFN